MELESDEQQSSVIQEVKVLVEQMQLEQALQTFVNSFDQNDDYHCYLLGKIYHMQGDIDNAKSNLMKAVQLAPNSKHYKKYFLLAEISKPLIAIECYNKGIELICEQIEDCIDIQKAQKLNQDLVQAYCGLAEIYQTDLVQLKESEEQCQECIEKALEIDSESVDALEQQANFYLNKENEKQCQQVLEKIHSIVQNDTDNYQDIEQLHNIGKLMVEVEEYDKAVDLFHMIDNLDNQNLENQYFMAFCHFKLKNYSTVQEIIKDLENDQVQSQKLKQEAELYSGFQDLVKELEKVDVNEFKNEGNDEMDEEKDWEDA